MLNFPKSQGCISKVFEKGGVIFARPPLAIPGLNLNNLKEKNWICKRLGNKVACIVNQVNQVYVLADIKNYWRWIYIKNLDKLKAFSFLNFKQTISFEYFKCKLISSFDFLSTFLSYFKRSENIKL